MATTTMQQQVRQGDVLVQSQAIPRDAAKVPPGDGLVILARGEATGHHHSVPAAQAALLARGAERFLRVKPRGAPLQHQEHAEIWLPGGTYEVTIQREYGFDDMSRQVAD
jgi:hypothetical protein